MALDGYDGDATLLVKLLLPGIDQRVYNVKEKSIIKYISMACGTVSLSMRLRYSTQMKKNSQSRTS